MRFALLFLLVVPAWANTCTAFSVGAQGPFPAIPSNGVDGISWSVARFQWTSDQSPSAATAQRLQYATAAEWAATGPFTPGPGIVTYPHVTGNTLQTTSSGSQIQGVIGSNFIPNTLYHFAAQSNQGGSWCTTSDQTFTTLARPLGAIIYPTLPIPVDTTRPAMSGTHWVFGSNCGTTAGSGYAIDTANLQDCFNQMRAGDDLALPPRVYLISQASLNNSQLAVNVTCSTGTNFCDNGATAPANGSQIIMGGQLFGVPPSPINPGIPYYVVNRSGSTFQISYDGTTPITLLDAGSLASYLPYPLTQAKMVIHSTAAASLLPPPGVRIGPDALAQYLPNMPILEAVDPILGAGGRSYIQYSPLTVNLTWENVGFAVDGTIATSTNAANPADWPSPIQVTLTNQGIVYDQCAFPHPGAPSRIAQMQFNGVNNAIVNSYVALDYWQTHLFVPSQTPMTISGNTITIPAATWSYPGPSGTKVSCSIPTGTITISGAGSGQLFLWTNADCTQGGSLTTGLSASTTITGLTITNAATAAYPTYTYTSVTGLTELRYAAFPLGYPFTITSGTIIDTNSSITGNWFDPGINKNPTSGSGRSEGSSGIEIAGWGPLKFDNNYVQGSGIGGIFWADDLTLGTTPCGSVNPCNVQAVLGNLTVTRNTFTTDAAHFFYDSPSWDGGNRYWRNDNEQKVGEYSLWDGNIIGPWSAQVGEGQCGLHEEFDNFTINIPGYPSYVNSSDWTFTNNTCLNMPSTSITSQYSFQGYVKYGYPVKNFLIQNDLLLNNNAYAQVAHNQPFRSDGHVVPDPTSGACPQGQMTQLAQGENYVLDHLTVSGMGGCQPFFLAYTEDISSSTVTNNVLNLVNDPGPFTTASLSGTNFNADPGGTGTPYLSGACVGAIAPALFACINNFTWAGNVLLATYTNSLPGSQTEFTTAQIGAAAAYFSGYPTNIPNANTLAQRQAQIEWFNVNAANFRISATPPSPYISGNTPSLTSKTTDGLDVGVNQDRLEQHQGKVSNVRFLNKTSTAVDVYFYAPDSFACGVDWGTTSFFTGSGSWTRVAGAAGSPDVRVQHVSLTGLPSHGLIYYRLNCAVVQQTGTIQLP